MAATSVTARTTQLAQPLCEQMGLTLWDVEFQKEGADWVLRLTIDKQGGVGIEDCEAFSRLIDPLLDEANFIEPHYLLEVSSPGIFRTLKYPWQFERFYGERIEVRLFAPQKGTKQLIGILEHYHDGELTLVCEDGERMALAPKQIAAVQACPLL